jgi:hypothetical protein
MANITTPTTKNTRTKLFIIITRLLKY